MALAATVPTETVTVTGTKPKPSAAPSTSLGGLENKLIGETNQAEKDITSYQDSVGKLTTDFHQQLSELKSQAPKPPEEKPFTPPQQQNPISAFGSTAGLLAGIASLFSRSPLTASLNAVGAGMKAINEGNSVAYQRSFDEWKANTDYAFKVFDAENRQYDSMINLAKTDYDSAVAGIKTLATMTDDKATKTALAMKGVQGVEELNIERGRLAMELQANSAKMIPGQIFNTSLKDFVATNHRQPTAQEMGKMWQDTQMVSSASNMSIETLQSIAQRYIAGDKSALSGLGFGNAGAANRAMVQNFITEQMHDQNKSPRDIMIAQAELAGLMSKERALGTQEARVGTAVDELTRVAPLALTASAEVARTNLVPWNHVQQAIQHGTSDPKLARLVAATQTLINVYARATNPLGVARVSDKDHARDMLSEADGPQAYAAVINQMMKEAEAAGMSPGDIRESTRDSFLGTTPSKPQPSANDIYEPESGDDFNALPSGARYRKPGDPPDSYRVKK